MAFTFTTSSKAVEIVNDALTMIGIDTVTGSELDNDTVVPAKIAARYFHNAIKSVLRQHNWNCVAKRENLSLTNAPTYEYTNAFIIPADYVRLIDLWLGGLRITGQTHEGLYKIESNGIAYRILVTDSNSASIRYVFYPGMDSLGDTYFNLFDPLLKESCVIALAAACALPLTTNVSLVRQLQEQLLFTLAEARLADAKEDMGAPSYIGILNAVRQ